MQILKGRKVFHLFIKREIGSYVPPEILRKPLIGPLVAKLETARLARTLLARGQLGGRTLSQLAALGLIARITLPHLNPLTLERQYLKAFRPLRDDEHTQFTDVEALRRALSPAGEVGE